MSEFRIENLETGLRAEVKRLHLPTKVYSTCPECGMEICNDFTDDDYLSYPPINEEFEIHFGHENDDFHHEWSVPVVLRMYLEKPKGGSKCIK